MRQRAPLLFSASHTWRRVSEQVGIRLLPATPARYFASATRPLLLTGSAAAAASPDWTRTASMLTLQTYLRQYTQLDGTEYLQHYATAEQQRANHVIIPREKFDEMCMLADVEDASQALEALADAGMVVPLAGGSLVHLRPVTYLSELELMAESGPEAVAVGELDESFLQEGVQARIRALEAEEAHLRRELEPAIAKAARWRRSVWGGALCFAGAQLAIISRLTYFDLDWDIMEPVSYTIGIGTALIFYLYYLRHDTEHTYPDFDAMYLPKKVKQYAPRNFDWTRYERVCQELADADKTLQNLKKWASSR